MTLNLCKIEYTVHVYQDFFLQVIIFTTIH